MFEPNTYNLPQQILAYKRHRRVWRELCDRVESRKEEKYLKAHIEKHPNLFGSEWETTASERTLKNSLQDIGIERPGRATQLDGKRLDILLQNCSNGRFVILELMRPGKAIDYEHVTNARDYCAYLNTHATKFDFYGLIIGEQPSNPVVETLLNQLPNHINYMNWAEFMQVTKPDYRWQLATQVKEEWVRVKGLLAPAPQHPLLTAASP